MDDPHKRVNGNVDVSKKSSVPSRYHQFMTSEDEAQSSSAHSSENEEEEEEVETTGKSITSTRSALPVLPQVKSEAPAVNPAPAKDSSQVLCDEANPYCCAKMHHHIRYLTGYLHKKTGGLYIKVHENKDTTHTLKRLQFSSAKINSH